MSGRRASFVSAGRPLLRALLAVAALACAAATVRASEKVPVQTAPDDGALGAAKDELDALKADGTRAHSGVTAKFGPDISLPQVGASSDVITPPPPRLPTSSERQRSANWLVDGVMQPDRKRDPRRELSNHGRTDVDPRAKRPDTRDRTDSNRDSDDVDRLIEDQPDRAAAIAAAAATVNLDKVAAPTAADADPLAKYMSQWLSPQDFALFKQAADLRADIDGTSSSTPNSAVTNGAAVGPPGFSAPSSATASAGDNPFLDFLQPPPPPVIAPPPEPVPATTLAPAPEIVPPSIQSKSTVPDFVKPATEEKYFKPLKRF